MITIKLVGGLGNQMFQYAAARALAEHRRTDVILDLSWFNQQFDNSTTPRRYELDCFELENTTKHYKGKLNQKVLQYLSTSYGEPHFHYDSNFFNLPSTVILRGYFQSEKYFKDVRNILLGDFAFIKPPKGKNASVLREIKHNDSSMSVHVRRGDYVSNENAAKFHGLTGLAYYHAAVKYIEEYIKNPTIYVFSDDPDWCKENLQFSHSTKYITHNTEGYEDMRLMKACRHNIIANSSFSWWGAWLNQNPNKIVIAPKQWFAHPESNTKDLIPKLWHKI